MLANYDCERLDQEPGRKGLLLSPGLRPTVCKMGTISLTFTVLLEIEGSSSMGQDLD